MASRDITPSEFHLIVVGTGLQESLLAAGAAKAGKKVLHIDTEDFYGSHWASHQLGYFEKWCRAHASSAGPLYSNAEIYKGSDADLGPSNEYNIDLAPKLVYSSGRLIDALLGGSAQNYLEFKLLQQSYVWRDGQFWQVPASRADVFRDGRLSPTEKRQLMRFLQRLQQHAMATQDEHQEAQAFDDRPFIDVLQKEQLGEQLQETILYALAFADAAQLSSSRSEPAQGQQHLQGRQHTEGCTASSAAVSDQQPDTVHSSSSSSYACPVNKGAQQSSSPAAGRQTPEASSDSRQSAAEQAGNTARTPASQSRAREQSPRSRGLMSHAQGMDALAMYMRSAGRYGAGTGAFLLPVYGGGELTQAFCRVAAVAGAVYVLRQGITQFVVNGDTGLCQALLTSSGQELKAGAFAGNPETLSQFCKAEAPGTPQRGLSRAVLVVDAPLVHSKSQVLVVIPPGAAGSAHPVRALQLGEATACAPKDRYIVHLSTLQTAATAQEDLQQAVRALADLSSLRVSSSNGNGVLGAESRQKDAAAEAEPVRSSAAHADAAGDNGSDASSQACRKPRALLLAFYNQADHADLRSNWRLPENVALCSMPSPSVAYEDCMLEAEGLMQQLCPDLESLFAGKGPVLDDDSDNEAIEALSEALGNLEDRQPGLQ